MQSPLHGKFIVIEGPDNSGKTTQAGLLRRVYPDPNSVIFTTEPTKKEQDQRFTIGPFIRQRLVKPELPPKKEGMRDALLFYADRIEHVELQIRPALESGRHVVSDRYDASTIAYEGALGVAAEAISKGREYAILHDYVLRPDLTIIIDISLEEFKERNKNRSEDAKDKFHDEAFQEKVIANYKNLKALFPLDKIVYVDGMRTQDQIHREICGLVEKYLGAPRLERRLYEFQ